MTFIQNILAYITFLTEILPLIFCIIFYKKLNTKALKVFFIYTILLSIFVLFSVISLYVIKSKTFYLINIRVYVLIEYMIFAYFLFNIYKKKIAKNIIIYSIIPFFLFALSDYLSSGKNTFSTNPLIAEFLAFMIFIIYFFYEKMQTVVLYPLYQTISFWICVGLFLYFTGNFFFLIFTKSSTDKQFVNQLKIIYSFVTITKNIFLSLAFFANEIKENSGEEIEFPNDIDLDEISLTNLKKS